MKSSLSDILSCVVAYALVAFLIAQPIIQCISIFSNDKFEIVQLDTDEDTEETNSQKEDNKEEIKHLTTVNSQFVISLHNTTICTTIKSPLLDFTLEIPIPPPDFV